MPTIAFTVPVVPGKEEADIQWLQECGERGGRSTCAPGSEPARAGRWSWHQATSQGTIRDAAPSFAPK